MINQNSKVSKERDLLRAGADSDFSIEILAQRINNEVLAFMKSQRIACLVRGGWFDVPNELGKYLFCKLDPNHNFLLYSEFKEKVKDPTPYLNLSGDIKYLITIVACLADISLMKLVEGNVSIRLFGIPALLSQLVFSNRLSYIEWRDG
jgi:hypothetical protein